MEQSEEFSGAQNTEDDGTPRNNDSALGNASFTHNVLTECENAADKS